MKRLLKHRIEKRTLDFKTWSLIEYRLTLFEWIELLQGMIRAFIKATISGSANPMQYVSPELEQLLCGYVPTRHKVLKLNIGEVKKD